MRVAKISFTVDFLEQVLPKGSKIISVRENEYSKMIEVIIEHPSFDELEPGSLPPTRALLMTTDTHISKVEYAG